MLDVRRRRRRRCYCNAVLRALKQWACSESWEEIAIKWFSVNEQIANHLEMHCTMHIAQVHVWNIWEKLFCSSHDTIFVYFARLHLICTFHSLPRHDKQALLVRATHSDAPQLSLISFRFDFLYRVFIEWYGKWIEAHKTSTRYFFHGKFKSKCAQNILRIFSLTFFFLIWAFRWSRSGSIEICRFFSYGSCFGEQWKSNDDRKWSTFSA